MINYAETERFCLVRYARPGVFAFLRQNYSSLFGVEEVGGGRA